MTTPSVDLIDRSGWDLSDETSGDDLAELMVAVLCAEGAPPTATAGLHLVSSSEIEELNETHMAASGPTDVLSFPVDGLGDTVPAGQPVLVGDVLLSPEVAARQAPSHAGSTAAECRLLVVHGTLHLLGWDHDDPRGRRAMWDRERELLACFEMLPPRDPWAQR